MNQDQITKVVEAIISQSLDGQDIENLKVDCKNQWWDLKDISGLNEFLKDTCAIANTFGLDGYIIIGYNDKTKTFKPTVFSDSGCKDNLEIRNLIIKHVDVAFDINTFDVTVLGNKLSIIHLPPSVDKPHVLKVFKRVIGNSVKEEFNKIFIRKNSSNHIASKNDIDIMYYDRKNIVPEYKLIVSISLKSLTITGSGMAGRYDNMNIRPVIIFENQGARPIAIVGVKVVFSEHTNPNPDETYIFEGRGKTPVVVPVNTIVDSNPILLGVNPIMLEIDKGMQVNRNFKNIIIHNIELTTNSGETIVTRPITY